MGVLQFQPSRRASGSPDVRSNLTIQASTTYKMGSPLQRDTQANEIEEHAGGGTVTGIVGISTHGVVTGAPDGKGGLAYGTKGSMVVPHLDQEFLGQLVSAALPVILPVAATHEGVSYAMVKGSDGYWYVDVADTSDVVLRVTRVFPKINAVLFRFLASAVAI